MRAFVPDLRERRSWFADMGMSDPLPQFTHIVQALKDQHPDLAYLHLIEPGIAGAGDADDSRAKVHQSNDVFREIWSPRPFITAGGFTRESAIAYADKGDLIAFGRLFISNVRLHNTCPLADLWGRISADPVFLAGPSAPPQARCSANCT